MFQHYRALRPHHYAVLAMNLTSWGIAAVLTVLRFPNPTAMHWIAGVLVWLTATFAAAETSARGAFDRSKQQEEQQRQIAQQQKVITELRDDVSRLLDVQRQHDEAERARRRETATALARSLLRDAYRSTIPLMSKTPGTTGGVVFLPGDDGKLHTFFAYNKEGKPDRDMVYAPRQGISGHVWWSGRQKGVNLAILTEEELVERWGRTPEDIGLTRHLKVVVSTPVRAIGDPNKTIAVVTVDSESPAEECDLLTDLSMNRAQELAKTVARILAIVGLV